jgi:hypothetical protein
VNLLFPNHLAIFRRAREVDHGDWQTFGQPDAPAFDFGRPLFFAYRRFGTQDRRRAIPAHRGPSVGVFGQDDWRMSNKLRCSASRTPPNRSRF